MTRGGRICARWPVGVLVLALSLTGGCPGLLPPPVEDKEPVLRLSAQQVDVPVRMVGSQIFVDVWVDGAGPFAFILDTGASATFVDNDLALQFPLQISDNERTVADTDGTRLQAGFSLEIGSLEFGPAEVTGLSAPVLDLSRLSEAHQTPVHGILGFPLFEHASLEIDYAGERLRLSADSLLQPDAGDVIPFAQQNGRPYVTMLIGAQPVEALVDTGSTLALHLPRNLDGVGFSAGPRTWYNGTDLSGATTSQIARLQDAVKVGAHVVPAPVVIVGENSIPVIGAAFLQDYVVRFDTPSGQLQLVPKGERDGEGAIRTFGFRYTNIDGRPTVTTLLPGGPAEEQGVQVGDVIVRVNGISMAELGADGAWFSDLLLASYTNPTHETVRLGLLRADLSVYEATIPSVTWIP